ncbi:hypothetical protein SAMN05421678_101172 [Actinopolymorpha cephalotaxi]|uniref:Uncharacterized protein n=1 Tax=Actinopolymorpha cephalotaxi TaxID=504797 RepID=A0A1I2KGV0_9ACTN|nr:hypothetical protein [Actinopolymorpha cephalotaxi]NYH84403.1 hypothetical protein [Actinopolymorpha cephalotaxi]SFF64156.1 hypothetical protein SAMN05421678_101172 [Actinopolymorpha cephalotaxi]
MTTPRSRTVPPSCAGLIDDAAVFPPASEPLAAALAANLARREEWYAGLVGPFLCPDATLPELLAALDDGPPLAEPLSLGLVVGGGAGAIEPALRWAGRTDRARVVSVEVALRDESLHTAGLARNVARMDRALAAADLPDEVAVAVEVPRAGGGDGGWDGALDALDALAEYGHRAKFRTGGVDAETFPGEVALARAVLACLDRELPFKCTAGLHHAVRGSAGGAEHHGFLNVLLATRFALDGADEPALVEALSDRDADHVAGQVRALEDRAAASARRWFTSFGSCSVSDPLADLLRLRVLQD